MQGIARAPLSPSCSLWFILVATQALFADRLLTNTLLYSKEPAVNPRGIPYAPFVDKVEDYVTTRADVEPTLRSFQEMIA